MAGKRSRATFEADLQAQQSPYVLYGTPLPPLDPDVRDDGSYVPVWKQEVTDEQGRKRLHGAFTGGFSAGYFNTVGSKEGWTPSTFVSSRSNRNKDAPKAQQNAEDFMDEEDLADAEEARKLQTADAFAGLGSSTEGRRQGEPLMDLFRPSGETVGVKLLKKMGWREGQGIGPRVRRKAKAEDEEQVEDGETHLFAPENSRMVSFTRKTDRKGLGFEGEEGLERPSPSKQAVNYGSAPGDSEEHSTFGTLTNGNKLKKKAVKKQGGFGVGVLNDHGSDEEDPFSMGPQISYNKVIGGEKRKKKKSETIKASANPMLSIRPVFIPKKTSAAKGRQGFQRCHDGRLPIQGFALSTLSDALNSILSQGSKYPAPKIPDGWKSSKTVSTHIDSKEADQTPSVPLNPSTRAALLGEKPLPSKSVFDFLTPAARSRIVTATSNENLPPARSEGVNAATSTATDDLHSLIPPLAKETALAALGRGTGGWMPYADAPAKRARYVHFLEHVGAIREEEDLPARAPDAKDEDWVKEMQEFAHAATIFKPMSGAMASRFTSSASSPKVADVSTTKQVDEPAKDGLLRQGKAKTAAEEAAEMEMFGPLTRSVQNWFPTRLLCKRFNVKPPTHVQVDPSDDPGATPKGPSSMSTALPQKQLELVGKKEMEELRTGGLSGGMRSLGFTSGGREGGNDLSAEREKGDKEQVAVSIIDPERNEAIEQERPGEAIFKAIFGSDSEDD